MKKTAVIYTRVSTDEQAKGYSLGDQEDRLREYCRIKDICIIKHFQEDFSAKTFNRPEFNKLMDYLKLHKKEIDFLLFLKWDRFSRNLDAYSKMKEIAKLGIEVNCAENPIDLSIPENKLLLAFYLASPEVENDRRALNTMYGMRKAQKEGYWVASAPKGYSYKPIGGKSLLEPNGDAQYILEIYRQVADGIPVNVVWKMIKKKAFRCSQSQIYNIVRNVVYIGKIYLKPWNNEQGRIVNGLHQPIISADLFKKVQEILNKKFKKSKYSALNPDFPLRGHLICPVCGNNLTGSGSTNRYKTKYNYYHCQNGCRNRFRADELNEKFTSYLFNFEIHKEVQNLYSKILIDVVSKEYKNLERDKIAINDQIEKLQKQLEATQDKFIDGDFSKDEFYEIRDRIQSRINELRLDKVNTNYDIVGIKNKILGSLKLVSSLSKFYTEADAELKNRLISSIFPEKLIYDGEKYRTSNINEFIALFTSNINEYGMIEKRKAVKIDDFSRRVAPPGIEPESKV